MNWTSSQTRKKFLDYFNSRDHKIVSSAPIVNQDDPSLMFTNAGMNQFKDYFLGNKEPEQRRVVDSQKCLRVSGKHNDLEEVGVDSYHHTMFEMLGNWSFGDYFKEEAIEWAWKLLTEEYGIAKDKLYVTIFEGETSDGLGEDSEAESIWRKFLPESRILKFGKKDNFWEMGEAGPCGPCSEIHIDLRSDADRSQIEGSTLVNMDHPEVVEIWNLVFIQFNRKANGVLENLPARHIDTGMGFERLCMVLQNKNSTYDTDVFTPLIKRIESITNKVYGGSYDKKSSSDVAFRVVVDHLRAVAFCIADGALPANSGAGYVVRRILRRAVRYYYSFLDWKEPLIAQLVDLLADQFEGVFPELVEQSKLVAKVIREEEKSFLKTLSEGLKRLDSMDIQSGKISGEEAFELYDTYGFPFDLTALIAGEKGIEVDGRGFEKCLEIQRKRSRSDAHKKVGDWVSVREGNSSLFIGYENLEVDSVYLLRYRITEQKGRELIHLVLNKTPFYPEGGGQIGDSGVLEYQGGKVRVLNTFRENELIVHLVDQLPKDPTHDLKAIVDRAKRRRTENNHSATHLMHAALKSVLGDHVQQKGSLVADDHLRFDFSHFQKVSDEQIVQIEDLVNRKVRENIPLTEERNIDIEEARRKGATMLFGEKYGEKVRIISFDPAYSMELCGGCHVDRTGRIGLFKITSESSVAAGIRRVVAVTGSSAEMFVREKLSLLHRLEESLKSPNNPLGAVEALQSEIKSLRSEIDELNTKLAGDIKSQLLSKVENINGVSFLAATLNIGDSKSFKTLVFNLERELDPAVIALGAEIDDKPQLMVAISKEIANDNLHAGKLIKKASSHIRGGGGGQSFFASAGGSHPEGLKDAVTELKGLIKGFLNR